MKLTTNSKLDSSVKIGLKTKATDYIASNIYVMVVKIGTSSADLVTSKMEFAKVCILWISCRSQAGVGPLGA
jgi:hypothetical protein